MFLIFETIASEPVRGISLNYETLHVIRSKRVTKQS